MMIGQSPAEGLSDIATASAFVSLTSHAKGRDRQKVSDGDAPVTTALRSLSASSGSTRDRAEDLSAIREPLLEVPQEGLLSD